jgi:ABC-type dipeptide/oligopeptide/nickel transport system permease component
MNRWAIYAARRLLVLIPQAAAILTATFIFVRLLPGDPVAAALGSLATEDQIRSLRAQFGLDKSIPDQFWVYLRGFVHGDLGTSWYTAQPVLSDLGHRFPATLELVSYSLLLALLIGIPLGLLLAIRPGGILDRASFGYGMFAGSLPEFWWGLVLLFIFFSQLGWFPAPLGRISAGAPPPTHITGMYALDSLLTGNWHMLKDSVAHLALPVFTLVFVIAGPIMKMTRENMIRVLESDYILCARSLGLSPRTVGWRALRDALPPVVNLIGISYGYLIGGAVLVETVFSWGGAGQYAVKAISNSDYAAIQGIVLFAALFSLVVYFVVDVLHLVLDPRLRY